MTSCILTIIKNEHLYLDEWIQYHLGIGVNHIFIFEDIDSDSHSGIIKNYSQVTLIPLKDFLTPIQLKQSQIFKATKSKNPHNLYLSLALDFVHKRHSHRYDWCFVIDPDEFITLATDMNLSSALDKYAEYDAVILQWKCFGANGLISKPLGATLDSFAEPLIGQIPRKSETALTKTCYNLRTYTPKFFWYVHQPSDECNYCRTDLVHSRSHVTYDTMYIRHYITKSYEEYHWKCAERGYLWGKHRGLETFFVMNPDLSSFEEDLLFSEKHEILVVIPYIQSKSQGSELRLALNGWRRNCQFPYHLAVIGEFDAKLAQEFPWAEFIPTPTLPKVPSQYNPHLDIRNKFEVAYQIFGRSYPGFIYMVDDNYAIRPFSKFDIFQTHFLNPTFTGVQKDPTSFWRHDKWKTRQLLDAHNLPHVNYTTHFPCYFNFNKLKAIWDRFDMRHESYVPEDVYFNVYHDCTPLPVQPIRYGIWGPTYLDAHFDAVIADPNIKFLCNSVEGWSPELEARLTTLIHK